MGYSKVKDQTNVFVKNQKKSWNLWNYNTPVNNDLVEFYKNVKHVKGDSVITADASKIRNNFNNIIYKGNVRTLYIID